LLIVLQWPAAWRFNDEFMESVNWKICNVWVIKRFDITRYMLSFTSTRRAIYATICSLINRDYKTSTQVVKLTRNQQWIHNVNHSAQRGMTYVATVDLHYTYIESINTVIANGDGFITDRSLPNTETFAS
jgi:hypothetical protein